MNNKGFIFAETLATTLVIMILLISFYVFSTNFIDNQSKNKSYDNIEEIYKLANLRLFLYKNVKFNEIIEKKGQDNACIALNNIVIKDDVENTQQYSNMLSKFGISNIYLCDFEIHNPFETYDPFYNYFNYVNKTFNDKYRIIAHFSYPTNDKFASIKVWEVSNAK
ncbi:MAG: hypothetical protein IJO32_06370 [Bacilli bacterium]|nr:hypothetical protein [Bacilli bacterium]